MFNSFVLICDDGFQQFLSDQHVIDVLLKKEQYCQQKITGFLINELAFPNSNKSKIGAPGF